MNTGDVFYWNTDQVRGREERNKFHVYICEADWQHDHTFLFINKSNSFGCDFEITQQECDFLTLPVSFISCVDPVFYSDGQLSAFSNVPCGCLSQDCLARLANHVADHDVMEERYKLHIHAAIRKVL